MNNRQKDFSETQTEAQSLRSRAEGRERVEERILCLSNFVIHDYLFKSSKHPSGKLKSASFPKSGPKKPPRGTANQEWYRLPLKQFRGK